MYLYAQRIVINNTASGSARCNLNLFGTRNTIGKLRGFKQNNEDPESGRSCGTTRELASGIVADKRKNTYLELTSRKENVKYRDDDDDRRRKTLRRRVRAGRDRKSEETKGAVNDGSRDDFTSYEDKGGTDPPIKAVLKGPR